MRLTSSQKERPGGGIAPTWDRRSRIQSRGNGLWLTTDAFPIPQQDTLGDGNREIFDGPGLLT